MTDDAERVGRNLGSRWRSDNDRTWFSPSPPRMSESLNCRYSIDYYLAVEYVGEVV